MIVCGNVLGAALTMFVFPFYFANQEALYEKYKVYFDTGLKNVTNYMLQNIQKNIDLSNFVDMFSKTKNIYELAELIKKSEVLLCSDSAPMHIGVATDTKTIAIFGPTDDSVLLPNNNEKFIAVKNDVDCRPCLWNKRQTTCTCLECLDIDMDNIIKSL